MLRRLRTGLATASLAAIMIGCGATTAADGPPLLPTPAWGHPGTLLLRQDPGSQSLLLRNPAGGSYRYDIKSGRFGPDDPTGWERAGGDVADCERQFPDNAFAIDTATGRVSVGGRQLVIAGGRAVTTVRSPSKRWVAVVSSSGRGASLIPFLGVGDKPPFFHQVFASPGGQARGPGVRLPFAGRATGVRACWSPDERFVVYTDLLMTAVAIVLLPVEVEGTSK